MQVDASVDMRGALAVLRRAEAVTKNAAPVFRAIGGILVADAQMAFRDARDPWESPWQPLSPVTLEKRAAKRSGGSIYTRNRAVKQGAQRIMGTAKPLLDTGRLRNSITYQATADSVTVGTNVVYAGMQQHGAEQGAFGRNSRGGPLPWGNVPARAFLPVRGGKVDLPPSTRRAVVEAIASFILRR